MHGFRPILVWISLLTSIEAMDIMTTAAGRAHGAVESMPISAAVMNEGGMALFIAVKLALVAAGATAVLLALLWVRNGRPGAGWVYALQPVGDPRDYGCARDRGAAQRGAAAIAQRPRLITP